MRAGLTFGVPILALAYAFSVSAQQFEEIAPTHPAIQYSRPSRDPVANLLQRPGAMTDWTSDGPSGYLRSLLRALDVPVSSQILVFSKGSVQSGRIEAGNPRALYFNDSVVVGWVRGGFIEVAAQDPEQGTVFYAAGSSWLGRLSLARSDTCLSCHLSYRTGGVPGMIEPMGQTRPLDERWGGWYVTGDLGSIQHFGNVDVAALASGSDVAKTVSLEALDRTFDTRGYLTPHSDVAALMVFEHQMQMINLLTRVGWETRVARREGRLDASKAVIRDRVTQLVDYMLFVGEAPLASPIEGTSGFAQAFSAKGPRDTRGRTLRQLDLKRRVLRYPCSYMIHSEQFERLPAEAKDAIYGRLWAILSGADQDARYRHLSAADRQAIVEILRETMPDLPGYFKG